jgi:hypothetical protein
MTAAASTKLATRRRQYRHRRHHPAAPSSGVIQRRRSRTGRSCVVVHHPIGSNDKLGDKISDSLQGLASHFCAGSKPSRIGQTQVPDNADTEALSQAMEHLVCEVAFWRMAL